MAARSMRVTTPNMTFTHTRVRISVLNIPRAVNHWKNAATETTSAAIRLSKADHFSGLRPSVIALQSSRNPLL